ncbi:MAG: hypothetical protein NTW64_04485, partial [Candidatus Omnitrophica bacterium]|nr:hypothetical protein [Candidatus Omnitrophota bacterium]
DESNADFTILGGFTISQPNGSEVWAVGSLQDINWGTAGTVGNVKLEYSTNGGSSYPYVIVDSVTNTNTYPWTIPDAVSITVRVKVSDANNPDAFDTSNANFKIRPSITLTAPNGTESWAYNTSHDITWTKAGTIATVKLEYSTDGGSTYPNVIATEVNATTGTPYPWTIPDNLSTTCRVKVTNEADSSVYDTSNANFTIKGSVTLTAPNGTEAWVVDGAENITWTRSGSVANVKLEYSTNGGTTYPNLIIASTPGAALSYPWTIPDAIGSQLKVRITDVDNSTVSDVSDANFIIKGSVTLTVPNGGQNWVVGEGWNITWTRTGSFANVKIEYSTDGGTNYPYTIVVSTPASVLSYPWTIPDAIGTATKVRISDVNDSTVVDVSDSNFTIKGSLSLTAPNGGQTWIVGESKNITWTRNGSIVNVRLEYSKDGGSTYPYEIIASTPAAAGSYPWAVADAIDTDIRIKVSDAADSSVSDASDADFTIKGSLTITSPNAGTEAWVVNSSHNITWTRTGTVANVKLEYSTDGGTSYPNLIIASTPGADLSYPWAIPDDLSTQVRVKISNVADDTVNDTSDANFKIIGGFTLTSPNSGTEKWTVGTSHNITWTRTGSVVNAKLEYSTNGGSSYPNSIIGSTPAAALSYPWTMPDAVGKQVRVRISDASDADVYDTSDNNFSILGGFTITQPNGGDVWTVNESRSITWTTTGTVSNIKLEYSIDGGSSYPNEIVASIPNNNAYSWTVPDSISNTVRVKVSDALDSNAFDTSNTNFKIRGSLTLTAPNGNEQWQINTHQNITWTKVGSIANVKLEYSTNAFSDELETFLIIASVNASTGTPFDWTVPDKPGANLKVRVTDVTDSTVSDVSNDPFSVKGSLWITVPNGLEEWVVGDAENITWDKFGAITNVKLIYSTDGGTTYPEATNTIVASTPAENMSYSWTIPDAITNLARVKIVFLADETVFDESNANFVIKGSVTVGTPNGGESWIVAENRNITWTRTGSFANVKLEYSTNGFVNESQTVTITASTPASDLSYPWAVADAISTGVKVRVSDAANSSVSDVSNGVFTIKGALTLTAPNGNETWIVGISQNITWNRTGSVANVKLEYSTNGGTTYPNLIIASTPAIN